MGRKIVPVSLYGIRIYTDGAVLAPHVDRLPLVSSCIINVDQDVDEPWPIEVYSHAGKAYNVTMESGDMVLYESHTVLHGRPWKMKGRHFANIFVHYEPVDHAANNKLDREPNKHLDKEGIEALQRKAGAIGGHEAINHDEGEEEDDEGDLQTAAHEAARDGELETLVRLLRSDMSLLTKADRNGWLPLHEVRQPAHAAHFLTLTTVELGCSGREDGDSIVFDSDGLGCGLSDKARGLSVVVGQEKSRRIPPRH